MIPGFMGVTLGGDAEPGQHQFPVGSTFFVVPEGVTKVGGVVVAPGGDATSSTSGAGGGLLWFNDFPVMPGKSFQCVNLNSSGIALYYDGALLVFGNQVGTTSNLIPLSAPLTAGTSNYGRQIGGDGATVTTASGGGAAGYTAAGQAALSDVPFGGGGIGLLGGTSGASAGTSPNANGQEFGGGGAVVSGVGAFGAMGGCRLIWGPLRAFPNTNTGNV